MKIDKTIFKVEFTKGTGAGGQHKNKVETCATVTHLPTGKKEKCEDTRYKNKNLETAYKRLTKRVEDERKQLNHDIQNKNRVDQIEANGVIRTYNYQRNEVKDHRSGNVVNLKKFLDGKIDLIK